MSSEPNPNVKNALTDITPKVHGLVEKSLKLLKKENEVNQEHLKQTPEVQMDLKFRRNIVKRVAAQLLDKEKPHVSTMQNEVQEIRDKLSAFQKRTDNIIEDLKFIKMLMLEANNRLDDLQISDQGEVEI